MSLGCAESWRRTRTRSPWQMCASIMLSPRTRSANTSSPWPASAEGSRGGERPGGASRAGSSLERALALERPEVVERGAGRDLEPVADLAHRRRHTVSEGEVLDEPQDLTLSRRQISHVAVPVTAII